ncbi:hypothetical protein VNI00_005490 [Paramarasmius palmivorus]|uniref:Retrotransposon hot spot protein,C-terminal domain-containing protein n=1 Tax=Paramarasmius palmivorus TaxID=297713 RepID=A0AAW0DBC5_9AGAR
MTSTEESYFQDPSNYLQTLHSTGWKEGHAEEKYRFWKQAWDQQEVPKLLRPEEFADAMADPSYLAETFPTSIEEVPQALLRNEYCRVYDWLCALDPDPQAGGMRTALPITGHPGTGKTIFREYVLYRRCMDHKPTLYFDVLRQTLYLFHKGGVLFVITGKEKTDHTTLNPFKQDTWLLLDGLRPDWPIPDDLLLPERKHPKIVFTASPSLESEWERWQRYPMDLQVVYMQGWKDYELRYGSVIYRMKWTDVAQRLLIVGPIPRHLFNLKQYKTQTERIDRAIRDLTVEHLKRIQVSDVLYESFGGPRTPHRIQYINRTDNEDVCAAPRTFLLSEHVAKQIRHRLVNIIVQSRVNLIEKYSGAGHEASLYSYCYEVHILRQLAEMNADFQVDMYRMVRLPAKRSTPTTSSGGPKRNARRGRKRSTPSGKPSAGRKKLEPPWYTAYGQPSKMKELQDLRSSSAMEPVSFVIKPMDAFIYEPGQVGCIPVRSRVLYVPRIPNETPINAFYVDDNVLWLLQLTVGASHVVRPGLLFLKTRFEGLPDDWRLIFVQPYQTCMMVPYEQSVAHIPFFHLCIAPDALGHPIPKVEANLDTDEPMVSANDDDDDEEEEEESG